MLPDNVSLAGKYAYCDSSTEFSLWCDFTAYFSAPEIEHTTNDMTVYADAFIAQFIGVVHTKYSVLILLLLSHCVRASVFRFATTNVVVKRLKATWF